MFTYKYICLQRHIVTCIIFQVISKLDIFPLMCATNKVRITEMTLIHNKMNCELMPTYDTPAYMFNVYKNQQSQQTGSRNLMGPKTLTTIWGTYMKLVTKYHIPVINSC